LQASAERGIPGTTFGRVAEAYSRTRPPYSTAVVELAAPQLFFDTVHMDGEHELRVLTELYWKRFV